jgi:hypothetical protein
MRIFLGKVMYQLSILVSLKKITANLFLPIILEVCEDS